VGRQAKRAKKRMSMKRHFSCLTIIVTMLLFGASGSIEGSEFAALGKVAVKGMDEAAVETTMRTMASSGLKLTEKSIQEFGAATIQLQDKLVADIVAKSSAEVEAKAALKITDKAFLEGAGKGLVGADLKAAAEVEAKAEVAASAKLATKAQAEAGTKIMADAGAKIEKLGATLQADSFVKFASGTEADFAKGLESLTLKGGTEAEAKLAGKITESQAKTLTQEFAATEGILAKTETSTLSKIGTSAKSLFKSPKLLEGSVAAEEHAAATATLKSSASSAAEKAIATKTISKLERSAANKFVRSVTKMGKSAVMMAGGTMAAAVLFMIPSIFQSSFLAQQAENALLQTYIPPTQFGGIVMQLPDSVINMGSPSTSEFVYYGIPVSSPGAPLSAAAKAAYPGITGPTAKNKISASVNNNYAQAFSVGATKKISIPRYNLDAHALANLPIFVSYSDASWSPWGANGIADAAFSQTMINLNTGYVFYADGTSQGTPAATLVGPKGTLDTVQSFMNKKYGQLTGTGAQATYTQYVDSYASAKTGKVSDPLSAQFNCACLTANNGVLSADTVKTCSAKGSTCLLTSALNQLSGGLVINAAGKVMTPDQDMATEIAKGALGQVIPIQGLGDGFNDVLALFPGAQQNALANSGVLTISLGSNLSDTTSVKIQGADPDNYVAKGVYVYQCKNTPLAKILKSQSGGSGASAYSNQITDFIVFLDADLNQVAMMAPIPDPKNYNFITMGLNPAIKYFSTIIGSVDGNGGFTFLPQLNIQSPAALVAKGLPATFAPLYGLQASNGSLAINYNQNLPTAIGAMAQALLGHAKLGQQFKTMQSAMIGLLAAGPFGKYKLSPVAANMQPSIGGVALNLYTGFNGYPASQDQAQANCTDVLIPLSSAGKTVTLPSNNVAQYYGLVTDFTYTVLADGSITVATAGFANSSFNPTTWAIDPTKASQFYWITKLTSMGKAADPAFAMPQPLVDFVTKARAAWIGWVKATAASGLSKPEFMGVAIPGTTTVLTSASQQALANGLYIYTCSPCPSSATQDYFVLTNSPAPQAADPKLGSMSATTATAATNMLSIISGILYNSSGIPVKNAAGGGYSVNAATILKSLSAAYPQGLANDLKIKLNISVGKANAAAMAMVYPFPFGDLQLGLYQADIDTNVYLYFDASGAGASAGFQPQDYFVAVDSYTSPAVMGTKLAATTKYMVSLVTGQAYGPSGVLDVVTSDVIASIIGSLSPRWRAGVATQIATLTAQQSAAAQSDSQQTASMDAAPIPNTGIVTWPQSSAMQVITALASQNYLADPYTMLKQDPTSGQYVLVSPASADGTLFMYTFFNVPNSVLDANGNPIQVAAAYDGQGNLLRAIEGVELVSMMHQYGIGIDSTGKQYLGASNSLPIMQLDPADVALRPGVSGKSMIYSNDPNFPSHGIVSPVAYQNTQFYFYYNTITQGYYAMQVNGADIRYIDMAGGSVYNLNGSSRIALNPVGVQASGDMTDLFLPYLNPDSFVRCVMKNADNNNAYSDFLNSSPDFQVTTDPATNNACGFNLLYSLDAAASNVNIAQMPFPDTLTAMPDLSITNQYNVYFDQSSTPVTYMVNPNYTWQNLQLLPINMTTRALLNPMPNTDTFGYARLILNGNAMYAMIFAGQFFSGAQQSGTSSYTMKSGTNQLTVSMKIDTKTNAQYIEVVAGGITYNYQCAFLTLSDAQLTDYRHNAWQAEIIADVTGNILLEEYISIDASGNLQLVPVSINSVTNMPTDPTAKSTLSSGLGNIMQDSGTARFVATVDAATYPYFTQAGYVDLENGVLFDATGLLVGYTLQYSDLMTLLSSLSVAVVRDATGKATLTYRAPMPVANINPALSALVPSYVPQVVATQTPVASTTSTYTPAPAQSSYVPATQAPAQSSYVPAAPVQAQSSYVPAPVQSSYAPAPVQSSYVPATSAPTNVPTAQATQAPSVSATSASTYAPTAQAGLISAGSVASAPGAVSINPQIAKLQLKNQQLQADIANRQKALATETVAHRKQILQNAIKMENDQIAADNKQLASLGAAAASRSTLLGRLSSNSKKKNATAPVKNKKSNIAKAIKGVNL
jgi:hypothetical protein